MTTATIRFAFCFFAAAACILPQGGESTEILGIVEDSSGAVIPGVEIKAKHVSSETNAKILNRIQPPSVGLVYNTRNIANAASNLLVRVTSLR